mmetsp:Transcript_58634/g.134526  ORF Transcript_58634/g.134526 Transcript_58634/m.134526 type:complete len:216 (+) Transcript_58634:778-1425(+)
MYAGATVFVAAAHVASALGPSITSASGSAYKKDMTVRTPKRFSGVMFSPLGLSIDARERILRAANARLESMAPKKDTQVNESSDTEASATPNTIGSSEMATGAETVCPSSSAERPHVNTGSAALTICVNETAPAPAETTAPMCPMEWQKEMGARVRTAAVESFGGLRRPVSHKSDTKADPTASEAAECAHGSASALSRTLFAMLYPVDRPNHRAK